MTTETNGETPADAMSRHAACASLAAGATFIALLAVVHFIRPELDPSWRAPSEYALGRYGWVMTVAFLAWGLSAICLFVALRRHVTTRSGRVGLAFLLMGAAGPILAAIFPMDPITAPADAMTTSGTLHSLGAVLGDAFPIAATLLTWSLVRNNAAWMRARKTLVGATVLAWAGFFVLTVSMAVLLPQHGGQLGPEVSVGWQARFMMIAFAAWLMTAAWCAIDSARELTGASSRGGA